MQSNETAGLVSNRLQVKVQVPTGTGVRGPLPSISKTGVVGNAQDPHGMFGAETGTRESGHDWHEVQSVEL